jgi:hypothetical protein
MSDFETHRFSDAELMAEFDRLFPQGFAGADVLEELAPAGWEKSAFVAVFHPSVEQVFEEQLAFHRNIQALPWAKKSENESEPTLADVAREYRERPIDAHREVRELVGQCLWDVFSDNHEVVAEDGRVLDLGSFRGSGEFLADLLNRETNRREYDYMSFYLGTIWIAQRADLTPVYEMIFRRLQYHRLNWVYHFPRLQAVDLRPLRDALEQSSEPEWANYSPENALAKESEDREHDRKLAEMREMLDEAHQETIEDALRRPPPMIVRAYQTVYGCLPRGWPPV